MPDGADIVGDELPRIAALVADTAPNTRRSNVTGNAADLDPARVQTLVEWTGGKIENAPPGAVGRRFQLRAVGLPEPHYGGQILAPYHDVDQRYELLVGYDIEGGKDSTISEVHQTATDDMGLVWQKLRHPDNRGTRTVTITQQGTDFVVDEPPEEGAGRLIVRMLITSWLRPTAEAA